MLSLGSHGTVIILGVDALWYANSAFSIHSALGNFPPVLQPSLFDSVQPYKRCLILNRRLLRRIGLCVCHFSPSRSWTGLMPGPSSLGRPEIPILCSLFALKIVLVVEKGLSRWHQQKNIVASREKERPRPRRKSGERPRLASNAL